MEIMQKIKGLMDGKAILSVLKLDEKKQSKVVTNIRHCKYDKLAKNDLQSRIIVGQAPESYRKSCNSIYKYVNLKS